MGVLVCEKLNLHNTLNMVLYIWSLHNIYALTSLCILNLVRCDMCALQFYFIIIDNDERGKYFHANYQYLKNLQLVVVTA